MKESDSYSDMQIKTLDAILGKPNPVKGKPLGYRLDTWAMLLQFSGRSVSTSALFLHAMVHDLADRCTRGEILALMTNAVPPGHIPTVPLLAARTFARLLRDDGS